MRHVTHWPISVGCTGTGACVADALGNTTRIEPNPAGLAVQVTDPLGATVVYQRDALGRVISIADPVGGTARLGWSVENRLTTLILPSGASETWEYDPEGNPVTHVDAIGQITRTTYGPFDLPVSETKPDGTRLEFSYDTELRLVQVTNPQGLRWRYTYDSTGDLVQETDFNDRVLRYTHDPAGQLSRRVNGAGEPIDYVRDALGNITEQRSGDRVTRFAYDAAGRLTRAISPDADLALHYDALGRVLAETCNGRTLTSTYDAVGRQIHRRTPSGAEANWTYDRAGRPVGLATAGRVLQLTYDAAGRETRRHIGTGAILDQQYDADHQLISQALWGAPATRRSGLGPAGERSAADGAISPNRAEPRLLQHRTYTRRRDGHVTAIGDRLNGNRTFDLDRAGRVTAVNAHSWTERYAYDPAGNLTHTTVGDRPEQRDDPLAVTAGDHTYSGNLVRRAGRTMYDHDGQGRLIRRRHRTLSGQTREWSYTWDADDRLTAVTTPEGQQWRYHYDALGRRTAKQRLAPDKVTVSEETLFAWEGPHLAEQTTRVPGNPEIFSLTWDRNGIHPLAQTERRSLFDAPQHVIDQRFFAIVTDLVGTPTELVSGTGDIAWRSSATLWGVTTGNRGATAYTPLRFPGQYFDPETQLHYNYFRHYDPTTALYTSPDPLGLDAGPNPRAYVLNPLGWVDYLGLLTCKENAAELRKNMAADTPPRVVKPGEAAAHIVPSGMNRGPSAQSRALLAKYGVDINEAANGIPLGHPTPHNFTHYKAFLVRVHNHLTQVEQRGLVRGLGSGAIGNELRGALRDIGKAVQGELAGGNPGPGAIWTKVP